MTTKPESPTDTGLWRNLSYAEYDALGGLFKDKA